MYAHVRLLSGCPKLFTYLVPPEQRAVLQVGMLVRVPLGKREEYGLVASMSSQAPAGMTIKQVARAFTLVEDVAYYPFIKRLSDYYLIAPHQLHAKIRSLLTHTSKQEGIESASLLDFDHGTSPARAAKQLTAEQQHCVETSIAHCTQPNPTPIVLHGITGSGKTVVYLELIKHMLQQGKSVLFLVPEVSLATHLHKRLASELEPNAVYSLHSATAAADRRALFDKLVTSKPLVLVGVHLPIYLPIPHLGLLILDEEHDGGFQEKKQPYINTKQAALLRAQQAGIACMLGSATPAITTLFNVHERKWLYLTLQERFAGSIAPITFVDLKKDRARRRCFWITHELQEAITQTLSRREQVILFHNRRGHSFFMQCRACSAIPGCTACSVSLTLHSDKSLRCHYCGYSKTYHGRCFSCNSSDVMSKGLGTQQVVSLVQELFPAARVERADADATVNKKKWTATLDAFERGEIDILVGTQTITKGYHFPRVTLVGVIWTDLLVAIPTYTAAEVAVQQLMQVAGRAGRADRPSKVIMQTLQDHPLYAYVDEKKYQEFYTYESAFRSELGYPPYVRMSSIQLESDSEELLQAQADLFTSLMAAQLPGCRLLGPAMPPVAKVQNRHIRCLIIKGSSTAAMAAAVRHVQASRTWRIQITYTPQP
jgi:primosomal protein N' (replication factor Y)